MSKYEPWNLHHVAVEQAEASNKIAIGATANHGAEAKCPKCGGSTGYSCLLQETHEMSGYWGESPERHGSSGRWCKYSNAKCLDCGAAFHFAALERKGLVK